MPEASGRSQATGSAATPFDVVGYWLAVGGLYLLELALWYYPFKEKVFDDNLIAPDPIKEQFSGSFIDSSPAPALPGASSGSCRVPSSSRWWRACSRASSCPARRKPILLCALGLSLGVFALLLFGSSMTSQFDSVASLFTYFGVTVILIGLVLLLPPYRGARWLSSLVPD